MTATTDRVDALLTATVVEAILFLDECADREFVPPEELGAESALVRHQLGTLMQDGKRKFLLQVLAAMYHEAAGLQEPDRAKHLAGLYHEFAGTPPP